MHVQEAQHVVPDQIGSEAPLLVRGDVAENAVQSRQMASTQTVLCLVHHDALEVRKVVDVLWVSRAKVPAQDSAILF